MRRLLLERGTILTLDSENRVLENHDVLVEGDTIAAVDRDLSKKRDPKSFDKVISAEEKIIMPGLVNAHFHSYDAFMKGSFEALPLEIWGLYMDLSRQRPFTENELRIRTLLVVSEMLHNGITTMHDNVTLSPLDEASFNAVMKAYHESGARAYVGATVKNRPPAQSLPRPPGGRIPGKLEGHPTQVRFSETLGLIRSSLSQWNGRDGRVWVTLAPSAPQRCTDDFLMSLDSLSAEFQTPISTHVLETKVQVVTGLELYGKSIVRHLDDLGFLSDRLSIHHGVWLNERDIDLLAEKCVSVVHNPVANLRLGSGIAPIRRMLHAGVNVALGCDNMTDNDSQNMFEAMKFAALLPEVSGPSISSWKPADVALKMATHGGARSLLCAGDIGSVEVGKKADLILLDRDAHAFTPLNDVTKQIVYSETGRSVDAVIVDGQVVVEDKLITTFDERSVLEEAQIIGNARRSDWGQFAQDRSEMREYAEEVFWHSVRKDIGINRYTSDA